ncbi:MAG: electron transport complex subunit RsxD [Halieaceae bacterium]|jgi:electron transport complex protein RnfD|nr:electron transport complex subunit RsxD [Halieaceae bacterium]
MALMRVTSPHAHGPLSTSKVMQTVLLATLPGVVALTWFFGFGSLVNIAVACVTALAMEALALRLRKRPVAFYLRDCSALVTATLLAIALPPYSPWWLLVVGTSFSIIVAKQLYGGLGYNPFNPAMVGYVVLLISFPVEMTTWAAPRGINGSGVPGLLEALRHCFTPGAIDAVTMATPLDLMKQNTGLLEQTLRAENPQFGRWAGVGWEWVNLGFLAGGAWMLYRRIFTWHAPVAMLAGLTLMATLFYDGGSSASTGSPLFHLLSGGTMFGAFFIITDPVSSAVSNRGRLIFGAAIGVLIFLIRSFGNYPDAVAFAVLIMNFAAPLIDHYTQPGTYGHGKARSS